VRKFCVHGRPRVKLLKTCCSAFVALSLVAPVAAYAPDPVVITLDGKDYISVVPVVIAPVERLVLATDSSLSNCHRKVDEPLATGPFRLEYELDGTGVDAVAMRIQFHPTQIILDTQTLDVVCDGQALGHQTGVGRVFRDTFEVM
jgi:hypothetical protein